LFDTGYEACLAKFSLLKLVECNSWSVALFKCPIKRGEFILRNPTAVLSIHESKKVGNNMLYTGKYNKYG
jgi:hypothetical protein